MANNQVVTDYDDAGFPAQAARNAVVSAAGTAVIKGSPGRLLSATVTASSTGSLTFYDNATTNSGTVLLVVPASAAVGTVYSPGLPAASGITVVAAASPSTVTIGYS